MLHLLYGTYIITHVIFTYILLITYVWIHDLLSCVSYLAIAFIVAILELLLIAFHVCPQINVQLHIVIPMLENKEPEDLENHFLLASVVTSIIFSSWYAIFNQHLSWENKLSCLFTHNFLL